METPLSLLSLFALWPASDKSSVDRSVSQSINRMQRVQIVYNSINQSMSNKGVVAIEGIQCPTRYAVYARPLSSCNEKSCTSSPKYLLYIALYSLLCNSFGDIWHIIWKKKIFSHTEMHFVCHTTMQQHFIDNITKAYRDWIYTYKQIQKYNNYVDLIVWWRLAVLQSKRRVLHHTFRPLSFLLSQSQPLRSV